MGGITFLALGRMSSTEHNRKEISHLESRAKRRFGYLLTLLLMGSILSLFLASLFGRLDIPVADVGKSILAGLGFNLDPDLDPTWVVVVFDIRLSRICLSMLVGMALAVAGTVFQGILRNPLADPFTIGVSTGAAFGASLALFLGFGSRTILGLGLLPFGALAGALAALFAVIASCIGSLIPAVASLRIKPVEILRYE